MKPLTVEMFDPATLQQLGRASVQIIHDLKNQINGLKLYATFLRKRMEKQERPEDERETIAKLIAGLERAAADMSTLVRFTRPVELRVQRGVNLPRLLTNTLNGNSAANCFTLAHDGEGCDGDFDMALLTEAFRVITDGASRLCRGGEPRVGLTRHANEAGPTAVIEWTGAEISEGNDLFRSFAGSDSVRMAMAARIIEAHGGQASCSDGSIKVTLPLGPKRVPENTTPCSVADSEASGSREGLGANEEHG